MLDKQHTQDALKDFLEEVISQAKNNLKEKDKNATKDLSNSFKYAFHVGKNSIDVDLFAEDYLVFVDKGVTGKGDSNFKGKKKTVWRSEAGYRFGSGNFKGKGNEWHKKIDKWMYARGIAPRDLKTGRFIKRDTANYLIRRSIFQHGLKPTRFFTDPFEEEFKKLPQELVEAFALDAETFMKFVIEE